MEIAKNSGGPLLSHVKGLLLHATWFLLDHDL